MFSLTVKMLRATILVLCLSITLGLASHKGMGRPRDPEINPDLFQGDIRGIPKDAKNVIVNPNLRWPNADLYYVIGSEFSASEINNIFEAFDFIEASSCVRFIQRTTEVDYVRVRKTGSGCNSFVGKVGGAQTLSLDSDCFDCSPNGCLTGIIQHEFLHALGFWHEQSRTDRDEFVTINLDNVPIEKRFNFDKLGTNVVQTFGAPYDYGSIMHYGAYDFAINPNIPVIITPNGEEIGQRFGLSEIDFFKLNSLYDCFAASTANKPAPGLPTNNNNVSYYAKY